MCIAYACHAEKYRKRTSTKTCLVKNRRYWFQDGVNLFLYSFLLSLFFYQHQLREPFFDRKSMDFSSRSFSFLRRLFMSRGTHAIVRPLRLVGRRLTVLYTADQRSVNRKEIESTRDLVRLTPK